MIKNKVRSAICPTCKRKRFVQNFYYEYFNGRSLCEKCLTCGTWHFISQPGNEWEPKYLKGR